MPNLLRSPLPHTLLPLPNNTPVCKHHGSDLPQTPLCMSSAFTARSILRFDQAKKVSSTGKRSGCCWYQKMLVQCLHSGSLEGGFYPFRFQQSMFFKKCGDTYTRLRSREQSNLFCQCLLTISLVACVAVEAHREAPSSETAVALAATLTFDERAIHLGNCKNGRMQ